MGKGDTTIVFGGLALMVLLASSKKSDPSFSPTDNKDIRLPFDGKLTTFVKYAYPYALEAHKQFPKIPVLLILTQSGLETGFGKAAPGNMFFGVKADENWKGAKQLLRTTEVLPKGSGYHFPQVISVTKRPDGKYTWVVRDYFRKYPTPLGSFLDYCKLLSTPHYAKVLAVSPDVNKMAVELKKAGYATGVNYVSSLQQLAALVQPQIRIAYPLVG